MSIDDHDPLEAFVVTRKIEHSLDAANDAVVVALETSAGVIMLRLSEEMSESLGETLTDLSFELNEAKDELEYQRDMDEADAELERDESYAFDIEDPDSGNGRFEDDDDEDPYLEEPGPIAHPRMLRTKDFLFHDEPSPRALKDLESAFHHHGAPSLHTTSKIKRTNDMAGRQAAAMVMLGLLFAGLAATAIVLVG